MTPFSNRKTLAAVAAAASFAGAIAMAGPAAASTPGQRVFDYKNSYAADAPTLHVTLAQMCDYYFQRDRYDTIVTSQPRVFETLASMNNLKIVALSDMGTAYAGGSKDEMILGFGGNDRISTGSGRDYVCGGAGDDTIDLGSSNDEAFGDGGSDSISGGSGNDRLFGDSRDANAAGAGDTISAGSGDDLLVGGEGVDSLAAGSGDDTSVAGNLP